MDSQYVEMMRVNTTHMSCHRADFTEILIWYEWRQRAML